MNLREIENQISNLRVRSYKYEKKVRELEDKVQDLETKTASDLSQSVVAESATSEEQDCLWVARDKRTDTLYVYEVEPVEQYCETFAEDDEEEKSFRIDFDLFPQVTFENSPQKLVLESSISKMETVEKDVLDKLKSLLSRIDKDYEENLEYSHYEEGQQDLIKEIREVIE